LKNKINNRIILGFLIFLFAIYNVIIYTELTSNNRIILLSDKALEGEVLWQENNCISCHQLYGLGGYLGPDLTNIISSKQKGVNYAKAFFNSGIKSMPKFNFSEEEKNLLVTFLEEVDLTGYYPNKGAKFENSGWVTIQYK